MGGMACPRIAAPPRELDLGQAGSAARPCRRQATPPSAPNSDGRIPVGSSCKNQARGRAMGKQSPIAVGEPTFGGADAATPAQYNAFRRDRARLGGDGPPK